MQIEEFQFNSSSKVSNYVVDWKLDDARAVICLVHGMGEHCRRYDHMAEYYAAHGIAMIGYDHAGHGRTKGTKGHADMGTLYNGINLLLAEAEKRYPSKPIILYGHSMGGNLVLNYYLQKHPNIKALVATGPWIKLGDEPPKLLEWIGRLMKAIFPGGTRASGLDANLISQNKDEVSTYLNDPLVHDRISFGLGISMLDAGLRLNAYSGKVDTPMLIMHGGADGVTDPTASKQLAGRLTGDVTHKEWEELYHEIHNEDIKEQVFNYTLNWLNDRLGS